MSEPTRLRGVVARALPSRSPVHRLARRRLGPMAVVAQSVGAIAPTAAMVTTPALLVAGAGAGAVWSALVGSLAVLLVAGAVNVFTRRLAAPGSLYAFAAQGLGPATSFATGCALLVGYAFVSIASLVAAASYLGALAGSSGVATQVALVLVLAAAIGLLVLRGVRTASVVLVGFEAVAIGIVVVAAVQLLARPGPHLSPAALAPSSLDLPAVAAGVVVAASAFIGFESSAALAPEVRRPFAVVPRAITWTVIGTSVLFVLGTYVQADGFARTGIDPSATASPLVDLVVAAGAAMPVNLLDAAIAISFFACATASSTALVRLLFAMGTEGMAPRRLGRVHARFRTPHVALAVSVPTIALVSAALLVAGMPVRTAMDVSVIISVLGYVLAYLLVCLAVPGFLRRIGERTAGTIAGALVAAAVLGTTFAVFFVVELRDRPAVPLAFAALMAAGGAWFWRVRWHRPERVGSIGVFDETSTEDVLWRLPDAPDAA